MDSLEEAVQLFLLENPLVELDLARAVVQFNWERDARGLDDLIGVEQYANTYADADAND